MRAKFFATAMLVALALPPASAVQSAPQAIRGPARCLDTYSARVCDTASLAPLRAELAHKFAAVLMAGNRTATWEARRKAALREIAQARDYEGKPLSDVELAQRFRDQIADLDKALAQTQSVREMVKTPSARGETCMATWLDQRCRVTSSGILWSKTGQSIYWQMMDGASSEDGVGAGIVLWAGSGFGTAKLIGWSFDGVFFEPPRLTQDGMIWVPGRVMGTGNGNADLLFEWDEASKSWQDIELESWRDSLGSKLPKGFGIWKGVDYDFEGLGAASKLWRESDANCCPSGGDALLDFAIRDRKLILTDVRVDIVEKRRARPKD
ncbi:hypothetical protein FPZ54_07255 [Sphingomonas suaedae]|uniref:DUF1311 domain-containing protein n=1 Tax=Sphingomonas suaedae TaxID=2599297 RepID=A0A518REF8_9SPHN|nr:hypothetical protein [Sphingomonas suaedae]QDX25840.1 hypothetical protein FPZ54_07255 [Sphingomonas suaedae]